MGNADLREIYACVMVSIGPITINEKIIVKYEWSGYYGEDCLCHSCIGIDTSDLSVLKPKMEEQQEGYYRSLN
jgi:hypothetical protein